MDKILQLKIYVDGVNDTPFPQGAEEPLEIGAFRHDAKRMGGAPTITASVNYPSCLDNEWTDNVYTVFNGEKYYLKQIPTSSYNNESTMYKHDLELVSERVILDNVLFYDAVASHEMETEPIIGVPPQKSEWQLFGNIDIDKEYTTFFARSKNGSAFGQFDVVFDEAIRIISGPPIDIKIDSATGGIYVYDNYGYLAHLGLHLVFSYISYENDKPVSNSTKFVFFGKIDEFAERLNASLQYAKLQKVDSEGNYASGYRVIVDDGITSEAMLVSFEDQYFSNAIQESYNTFKVPYYFVGEDIHFGNSNVVVEHEFSYGIDDALLSITKSNANNKIVNRVTGKGSSENIPYYYPNKSPKGEIELFASGTLGVADIKVVDLEKFTQLRIDEDYTFFGDTSLNTIQSGVNLPSLQQSVPFEDGVATVQKLYIEDKSVEIKVRYDVFFDTYTTTEIELGWELQNAANPIINMTPPLKNAQGKDQLEVSVKKVAITNQRQSYEIDFTPITEKRTYYDYVTYRQNQTSTGTTTQKLVDTGVKFSTPNMRGASTIEVTLKFKTLGNFWTHVPDYYWGEGSRKKPFADIIIEQSARTITTGGWKDISGESVNMDNYGVKFLAEPQYGDSFGYHVVKYITPSTNLLPPIYRATDGKERFYNAVNGEDGYKDENEEDIVFNNPYVEGHPSEHIITVDDIKPTIKGTKVLQPNGSSGVGHILPIDMFTAFAYDENDNDETYIDEKGETYFKHPYFFGRLRVLDFNLFECANENQPMTISFTSGHCGACNFEIGATEDYPQLNPVQVTGEGELIYKDGRVWCGLEGVEGQAVTEYQDRQQDTSKYEVWIALKKEEETYGVLMPSANIRPKACSSPTADDGDTFVILGINLPESYITNAEERLEAEIIKYMKDNNDEKFNFSITLSRIFFEENPTILEQLNENASLYVWYNGVRYPLYVSSISYNMGEGDVLPEVRLELVDSLSVSQNAIQVAISQVKAQMGNALANIDVLTLANPFFIRKDQDDEARGIIDFKKGIKFGEGGKVEVMDNNSAKLTIEYLEVTKKATFTSLEIQEKTHVGGQILISPAAMTCGEVEELEDAYRCYFQTKGQDGNDEIFNQFAVGDQAICQTFNAWGSRYYWRLVTGVGEDYIDLSKTDCDTDSDVPMAGDKIIQLGNRTDKTRQAAQVLSAYGETSPSFIMYKDIDGYSLEGKEVTGIIWNPATQEPQMYSYGNFFFGDRTKDDNGKFVSDFISFQPNPERPEEKKLYISADVQFGADSTGLSDLSDWKDLKGMIDNIDGERNYVLDSSYTAPSATESETHKYISRQVSARLSKGDVVAFNCENVNVLEGQATAFSAYIRQKNNYNARVVSAEVEVSTMNITKDKPYYTVEITEDITNCEVVILLYAGVAGYTQGKKVEYSNISLVRGSKPMSSWIEAPEDTKQRIQLVDATLSEDIMEINEKLDGVVENYFEAYVPTRTNEPAATWIANGTEADHVGDTFTNIETTGDNAGKSWRWLEQKSGSINYDWQPIADTDALKALQEAAKAKETADGKSRTFIVEPFVPYDEGDIWLQGANGDLMVCVTPQDENGSYSLSHWEKKVKYTDDSKVNELSEKISDDYGYLRNVFGQVTEGNAILGKYLGVGERVDESTFSVNAYLDGSGVYTSSLYGKLMLALGIPSSAQGQTDLKTRAQYATTQIFENGRIKSKDVDIEGNITAKSGKIGIFEISEDKTLVADTTSVGRLVLQESGVSFSGTNKQAYMGAASCGPVLDIKHRSDGQVTTCYGEAALHNTAIYAESTDAAFMCGQGMFYGLRPRVRPVQSSQELSEIDHTIININSATSTTVTLTLPSSPMAGQEYKIFNKYNTKLIVYGGASGKNIRNAWNSKYMTVDGSETTTASKYHVTTNANVIDIVWDGSEWLASWAH